MNKQEAIETIESTAFNIEDTDLVVGLSFTKNIINQIEEPQKPVVPKFVAEWIEDHKGDYNKWDKEARADFVFRAIYELFRFGEGLNTLDFTIDEKFSEWTTKNAYEFIIAILFDYTVEKEKLYTVEIPNPNLNTHVVLQKTEKGVILVTVGNARWKGWESSKLTEAEIRKDFGRLWWYAKEVE